MTTAKTTAHSGRAIMALLVAALVILTASQARTTTMAEERDLSAATPQSREIATLAGGCFWCLEAAFEALAGVQQVVSGYTGGEAANSSYEEICGGETGHAEAVQITFDPAVISYGELLTIFFSLHDPTTLNRQGADVGTQYRSAIFYHDEQQRLIATTLIAELTADRIWPDPIVTEVTALEIFYGAEDYHQDYYRRNSRQQYCQVVIAPKLNKLREQYHDKLKP